ncbi:hypothetical protein FSP39_002348 [Pinctada imbricata]|uniref:Uncharacterized protein n=1 Tax=Pinctada imbricata TaxID=66713 RepID=A0AA89BTU6_PINIB|nr:hypothetical protein FSP39_002348 [Pinctada imbricata]
MAYPTYDPNNGIVHDVNKNVGFSDRFTPQTWNDTSWYGDSVPGLNLVNLPRKDTITVPKFGYTVIRFRADNPVPTYSMDQKVVPSCSDTDEVCEFHWSVDYMWTMIYVNKTRLYGEPVTVRNGTFYRRNILKERLECDNYEKMTEEEIMDTPMVDGAYTLVLAINNQYPGPNIVVYEGQTVVVHVTNNLINEGVTIHWHGLRQRGTPYMDGVSMVTQCPINPDETFTYRFKADTIGTHWYHSHHGVTRTEGVYGPLIVLPRKERSDFAEADGDFIMMLQDRYHKHSSVETTLQQNSLMLFYREGFSEEACSFADKGIEGAALTVQTLDSIVINGKGHTYDKETGQPLIPEIPLEKFTVQPNKFYKFRIIQSSMLLPYKISIDKHPLIVMASDGNPINPIHVESLIVHNGERFDVMIYTQEAVKKYWIRVDSMAVKESDGIELKTPDSGYAILDYEGSTDNTPESERDECTEQNPCLVFNCHYGQDSVDAVGFHHKCLDMTDSVATDEDVTRHPLPMPSKDDDIQELFFNFHFKSGEPPSAPAINGKQFHKPSFPLLMAYPKYDPSNGLSLEVNQDVEFLDGFTSQRWNNTSWAGDSVPGLNLVNPPRKDTISVPKWGYTVIRFRADNPGFWFMHCHVETHAQLGMALVLQVGEPDDLPPIPDVSGDIKIQNFKESVDNYGDISSQESGGSRETLRTSEYTEVIYPVFLITLLVIALVQFAYILKMRFRLNKLMLRGGPLYEFNECNERKQLLDKTSDKKLYF